MSLIQKPGIFFQARQWSEKLGSDECESRDCFLLLCFQNVVPVGNAISTSSVLRMQETKNPQLTSHCC